MPLSERSLGAVRGAHHEEFEHNDVIGGGFWYNAPIENGRRRHRGPPSPPSLGEEGQAGSGVQQRSGEKVGATLIE
ncbi:MAG: hypothetical protein WDN72_04385 [Alphaproteobacteria bacterium]